jgi:hypothetical protein
LKEKFNLKERKLASVLKKNEGNYKKAEEFLEKKQKNQSEISLSTQEKFKELGI